MNCLLGNIFSTSQFTFELYSRPESRQYLFTYMIEEEFVSSIIFGAFFFENISRHILSNTIAQHTARAYFILLYCS